jgi:hypothetical protein
MPPTTQRRQPGCFAYGCIIALVLFLTVGGFVGYWVVTSIREAAQVYSSDTPEPLPTLVPGEQGEVSEVRSKVEALLKTVQNPKASGEYVFSAREVQVALTSMDQFASFREHARVEIVGDEVKLVFSVKPSELGAWPPSANFLFKDAMTKYFNGGLQGKFEVLDGHCDVKLSSLRLQDKKLEDVALEPAQDWLKGLMYQSLLGGPETVERLRELSVKNGQVKVVLTEAKDK